LIDAASFGPCGPDGPDGPDAPLGPLGPDGPETVEAAPDGPDGPDGPVGPEMVDAAPDGPVGPSTVENIIATSTFQLLNEFPTPAAESRIGSEKNVNSPVAGLYASTLPYIKLNPSCRIRAPRPGVQDKPVPTVIVMFIF
jgi:hypothetical protein